jgi:hypothetical protein
MHCFKFTFLQPEKKTEYRKTPKATEGKMLVHEVNDDCYFITHLCKIAHAEIRFKGPKFRQGHLT